MSAIGPKRTCCTPEPLPDYRCGLIRCVTFQRAIGGSDEAARVYLVSRRCGYLVGCKLKGCAASVFATATLLLVLTGFGHSSSPNASPARCAFEGLFIAGIVPCPDPGRRT